MIRVVIEFPSREATALREACRRFQYPDAQHLLRHSRNVRPDNLSSAITRVLEALTAAGVGSRAGVVPESTIAITFEVERAELATNRRFLEALLAATSPRGS
jgi:hypothetical protein